MDLVKIVVKAEKMTKNENETEILTLLVYPPQDQ